MNTSSDRLNTTFAALADPIRRAILARLASGEISVMKLAKPFAMSLPAASKHLKVLERAGLVARSRGAGAALPALGGSAQGGRRLGGPRSPFLGQRSDCLDTSLHELPRKEKKHGRKK